MENTYRLGIDGGGTATEFCAEDLDGRVLLWGRSGAININGQSHEQAEQVFADVQHCLQAKGLMPDKCLQIGVGAAGISNPESRMIFQMGLKAAGFSCPVSFFGDQETALAAAFEDCRGVVLISGTGSICYGVDYEGKCARTGGWGHLVDDRGSAYALAQDMFTAIFRARDGRAEKTVMTELVLQELGLSDLDVLIGWLYRPERSKRDIAALAVLVEQAADEKDAVALHLEERAAAELGDLAGGVLRQLKKEHTVALRGGVLRESKRIREDLSRRLKETYETESFLSEESAAKGALRLLRQKGDEED